MPNILYVMTPTAAANIVASGYSIWFKGKHKPISDSDEESAPSPASSWSSKERPYVRPLVLACRARRSRCSIST